MASSVLYDLDMSVEQEAANEPLDPAQRQLALQAWLAANYRRLHQRLLHQLRCPDLASECLHDAWLRLGETSVAAVQNPEAYVYRVACNVAMDRMRSNRPWHCVEDADSELAQHADPAPGPDRIATARSELAAVERAMARLPGRHRAVMVALRIDEMTRDEVAARYRLSLRRVDTALRQALDYCAEQSSRQAAGTFRPGRGQARLTHAGRGA
ncbi:sigma-70 family RNA polymerase sigma factor [Variovorax sp.]|jgi:RNA polymerase sigma factor (sigma-70 family)|uniref:RNA polymerase sigma factor n=2 Tax=unclassified Variovorax TaxID=663243 RepID=UPI000869DB92|nr:sigma-70 family RNA polymerase sigma factor [Variovorax sp.]ODU19171.1 MAG: hypothetical protein ABS94_01460 [Variovorax sp. SCN 67-85]ODV23396.1 MAG: hypothetical protein ABT25_19020 [Variovorax sp. SCN 67-20]